MWKHYMLINFSKDPWHSYSFMCAVSLWGSGLEFYRITTVNTASPLRLSVIIMLGLLHWVISSKNPRTFFCTCNWLHIYLWWKKFEHQNPERSPAWSKLRRNVSFYKYGADWGSDHHQQTIQQSACSNRKKRSFYFFLDYCNISSDQTLKQNGFLQSQQTVKLHLVHSWSMSSLSGGCLIGSTTEKWETSNGRVATVNILRHGFDKKNWWRD